MNEQDFWNVRNFMLNWLNWDYDYRESWLVKVDAIYEFQHFVAKERFPILACKQRVFDAHIIQIEKKLTEDLGTHLSLYQTYTKMILARLHKGELQKLDVVSPHYINLLPFKFTLNDDSWLTRTAVENRVDNIFKEIA